MPHWHSVAPSCVLLVLHFLIWLIEVSQLVEDELSVQPPFLSIHGHYLLSWLAQCVIREYQRRACVKNFGLAPPAPGGDTIPFFGQILTILAFWPPRQCQFTCQCSTQPRHLILGTKLWRGPLNTPIDNHLSSRWTAVSVRSHSVIYINSKAWTSKQWLALWCSISTAYFHGLIHWRRSVFLLMPKETPPGHPIQQSTTYCPVGGGKVMVLCLVKCVGDRFIIGVLHNYQPTKTWQQKRVPHNDPCTKDKALLNHPMQPGYGDWPCYALISDLETHAFTMFFQSNWYIVSLNSSICPQNSISQQSTTRKHCDYLILTILISSCMYTADRICHTVTM